MKFAILEERPRHFNIRFSVLSRSPIEVPDDIINLDIDSKPDVILAALQAVEVGTALTVDNITVCYLDNVGDEIGDIKVRYREAEHHHDQDWLRLVPIDQVGKRIYHGDDY